MSVSISARNFSVLIKYKIKYAKFTHLKRNKDQDPLIREFSCPLEICLKDPTWFGVPFMSVVYTGHLGETRNSNWKTRSYRKLIENTIFLEKIQIMHERLHLVTFTFSQVAKTILLSKWARNKSRLWLYNYILSPENVWERTQDFRPIYQALK